MAFFKPLMQELGWWRKERRLWRWGLSSFRNLYGRVLERFHWMRLPLRGRTVRVWLRSEPAPYYVRWGTSDLRVLKEIVARGEYRHIIEDAGSNIHTVVDLGANVGASVRYWLMHLPLERIVAVEPDQDNCRLLRMNVAGAKPVDIHIEQACVAGSAREVYLDNSKASWAYTMSDRPDGLPADARPIPALPLDDILEKAHLAGPIDLLKCDIEGSEADVFKAGGQWLRRVRRMVIELHSPYSRSDFLGDLARHGWTPTKVVTLVEGSPEVLYLTADPSTT